MKITKTRLKRIIREELLKEFAPDRGDATAIYNAMDPGGPSDRGGPGPGGAQEFIKSTLAKYPPDVQQRAMAHIQKFSPAGPGEYRYDEEETLADILSGK
jgi:hypothetical protein